MNLYNSRFQDQKHSLKKRFPNSFYPAARAHNFVIISYTRQSKEKKERGQHPDPPVTEAEAVNEGFRQQVSGTGSNFIPHCYWVR